MPTARYGGAAGVINGRIYVVGGAERRKRLPRPTNATIRTTTPGPRRCRCPRRGSTCRAASPIELFVIDGFSGTQLSTNEAFDASLTAIITINPGDTTPPTTSASYPQPNANGWNRFNMTVFLNANDPCCSAPSSGTQSITYALTGAHTGGGTFNTSSTSFPIINEGTTTVTFHATDNRGQRRGRPTFVGESSTKRHLGLNIPTDSSTPRR